MVEATFNVKVSGTTWLGVSVCPAYVELKVKYEDAVDGVQFEV